MNLAQIIWKLNTYDKEQGSKVKRRVQFASYSLATFCLASGDTTNKNLHLPTVIFHVIFPSKCLACPAKSQWPHLTQQQPTSTASQTTGFQSFFILK